MAPPTGLLIGGCLTCMVVVIVSGILIGMGFSKLTVNEVGIDYSANSLTLNTKKLYTSGIHFIGVGHKFIKYPRRQLEQTMEGRDLVIARSRDGLVVKLETKMLYSLVIEVDALASLYLMFREDHEAPVRHISRSVIRDVASQFTAFQFWSERTNVANTMEETLRTRLDDIFVKVETFLLSAYTLPADFQAVIDITEVENQEMNKVVYEMAQVEQSTQAIILQADQTVKQIQAITEAEVRSVELEAAAEIFKINRTLTAETAGYQELQSELGFSDEELSAFIWLEKMGQSESPKTIAVRTPLGVKLP